jgi:hypothetical protein
MIATGFRHTGSLTNNKLLFINDRATCDEYENAVKTYKQYTEEVRSDQRVEAAAFSDRNKYLFAEV